MTAVAVNWQTTPGRGSEPRPRTRLRAVVAPPSRRRPSAAVLRRRRVVAGVAAFVVCFLVAQAVSGWLGATATAGEVPAAPVVLVAEAGDTYWGLAAELDRGGDIRSTVDVLVRANGGRELRVGDRLALP